MKTPFTYGVLAKGYSFTNRTREIRKLSENFSQGVNTVIISPRRWGKSSLVHRTAERLKRKEKKIIFCFLDLYNVRSEEEFYRQYAECVLGAAGRKVEDVLQYAKAFLARLMPKITISPDPYSKFSLGFELKTIKKEANQILDLPERIAKKKKVSIVVCLDEFQNLATFSDPLSFQKKLRAIWQQHENVSYCIYGSRTHMLDEFFSSPSMPFYHFGEIIYLEKIEEAEWVKFICKSFKRTGKHIEEKDAALISSLVKRHPYYVQQLAQQCWLRTANSCSAVLIKDAHQSLIHQMSLLFRRIYDDLSNTQVQFLRALTNGETKLSSQAIRKEYGLGTSGNINRIKQALVKKEVLENRGSGLEFIDPIFESWIKQLN